MKSEMEIKYEAYLKSDDIVLKINSEVFYKIIEKRFTSLHENAAFVTVPQTMFSRKATTVKNENGRIFSLGSPVHISFRNGDIPKWYMETLTIAIYDVNSSDEIGEYLCLCYE